MPCPVCNTLLSFEALACPCCRLALLLEQTERERERVKDLVDRLADNEFDRLSEHHEQQQLLLT